MKEYTRMLEGETNTMNIYRESERRDGKSQKGYKRE